MRRASALTCLAALGAFWALLAAATTEDDAAVVQLAPEGGHLAHLQSNLRDAQDPTEQETPEDEKSETSIEREAADKEAKEGDPQVAAKQGAPQEEAESKAPEASTKQGAQEAAAKAVEDVPQDDAGMQAKVQENLAAVEKARSAVSKATKSLHKTDMEVAHNATRDATATKETNSSAPAPEPEMQKDVNTTNAEDAKDETTKIAQETSKLVKEKMEQAVKEADKEAKKDAEESAKAIIDQAKAKGETKGEKTIAEAEEALKKAKDEHAAATKKLAEAKGKAGISAVKFKATAKAIEGIKRQEEVAKIPVAEDDLRPRSKLSAVDWAKKFAEERLIAYRDHMDAAHAADREAAASQALLDAEAQVNRLEEEVKADTLNINELKGIVKEARFDAEEVKARGKFTTRGQVAKLKYRQIDEKNENTVSKEESKLIGARKKLMLSERALTELKTGGTLEAAQKAEKDALAELASADAQARIATEKVMFTKEKTDKANKLVIAKNEKKKAEKAVKAKKNADDLLAAQKQEQTASNKVDNAAATLKKVKDATEKGEKSAVQAKIASEKGRKADENKQKMNKMQANEANAKGIEKTKKSNEQAAKKQEKDELMKEKTAKKMQKSEIETKTKAKEKTAKDTVKEKEEKANKEKGSEEARAKKDASEAKTKKDKEDMAAAKKKERAEKRKEHTEKMKAVSAKGTPCDTCMAKCSTHLCRTWCNAHWCEGLKASSGTKEIAQKLKVAKKEQSEAASAMSESKQKLDRDVHREKVASGNAQGALTKAAETGTQQDVKEARSDTETVESDQKQVKEDKSRYQEEKAALLKDKSKLKAIEHKTYFSEKKGRVQ